MKTPTLLKTGSKEVDSLAKSFWQGILKNINNENDTLEFIQKLVEKYNYHEYISMVGTSQEVAYKNYQIASALKIIILSLQKCVK